MRAVVPVLLLLAHLSAGGAWAEDPQEAARAIGGAGRAAAAAVAKDPASASKVPGYAGTNLPERDLGAADLEAAAERALADPGDPGGRAGRAVIEGVTGRPDASLGTEDPIPVRGEEIQNDPGASRFGAWGLASGSVTDCAAGVEDSGAGGPCGSVSWCAGAGCETVPTQANTGFIDSAARLNMVLEMGGEEFDRENLRFFRGERRSCRIRWGGLADCCKDSGALIDLADCTEGERLLAQERHTPGTRITSERGARSVSSGSASAGSVSGASSARSSGASCRKRRGRSSDSAGGVAGASRSWRWNRSTSRPWTSPSSPRTSSTVPVNPRSPSRTQAIPAM